MNFSVPNPSNRTAPGAIAILVSALLGGMAGGVAWCFLSLWLPWFALFWIVPIAIVLAVSARWQGYREGAAIACTLLAVLIAFAYAQYLFGAVRIADSMGLPLREALFKAGFSLTADIAWANLRAPDWIALALAMVGGVAVARLRSPSRQTSDDS
ncbi:hypothetical protein [Rudaea sp.]|uniref:hypothetical protein n=1 Tax=Rudaea sp. TaxID=2136325 RepID=UPI002ED5BE6B